MICLKISTFGSISLILFVSNYFIFKSLNILDLDYERAIEEYNKILVINPNNIFAKKYKAFALAQVGDIKSASDIID